MSLDKSLIESGQSIETAQPLGRIVSVSGAQAIAILNSELPGSKKGPGKPEMGALVKIDTTQNVVLGLVSALSIPAPGVVKGEPEIQIMELELVGELPRKEGRELGIFKRGISSYPALGDIITLAMREELAKAYYHDESDSVAIGHLQQDETIPVHILTDDLLSKHFALLGSTGTGKSCAVALIFHQIIAKNPNAHVVLLDPHGEYAASFGEKAEVITPDKLNLPFWLLTFDEICEIFVGQHPHRDTDIEILSELIPLAKARYGAGEKKSGRPHFVKRAALDMSEFSTDTPVPYRLSDLIALLEENIGKLDQRGTLAPFRRLKRRIEQYSRDSRYTFMFGNLTVNDTMAEILGQIFRVPVDNKPVTILELGGLPSEVVNVAVSLLARMAFDFCLWSDGKVPITLVCEEAHRYVPADKDVGFEPTKVALSRIAKEGRKYGVSLCVISQRPSELMPTILSQCSTIIGLRMPNERDQEILRAAISDAAASILEFLPSMGNREGIAFGEAVALPVRFKFDRLSEKQMPNSQTWKFSEEWASDNHGAEMLEAVVKRWRSRTNSDAEYLEPEPEQQAPQQPEGAADSSEAVNLPDGVSPQAPEGPPPQPPASADPRTPPPPASTAPPAPPASADPRTLPPVPPALSPLQAPSANGAAPAAPAVPGQAAPRAATIAEISASLRARKQTP
jgi:DNA helicase HerA-like ATPase